jgi:hypothetical protein
MVILELGELSKAIDYVLDDRSSNSGKGRNIYFHRQVQINSVAVSNPVGIKGSSPQRIKSAYARS